MRTIEEGPFYETCSMCGGDGQSIGNPMYECGECDGTGQVRVSADELRSQAMEQAIHNTGYRDSGAEMADTAARVGMPNVVLDEYRSRCRKLGVNPKR